MNTTKEFFFGGVFSVMAYQRLPLHTGALNRRFSADSGFGHLPDLVRRTSTRYACPRRKRLESRKCSLIYLYFYTIISLKIKAIL